MGGVQKMRINENVEEYDVRNLEAIYSTVDDLLKSCLGLGQNAMLMERNISIAERDFTSENMERAKEIIKKYITKLSEAETELKELADSAKDFAEKLRKAWRPW